MDKCLRSSQQYNYPFLACLILNTYKFLGISCVMKFLSPFRFNKKKKNGPPNSSKGISINSG